MVVVAPLVQLLHHHWLRNPVDEMEHSGKSATEIGQMSIHRVCLESIMLQLASYTFVFWVGYGTTSLWLTMT